MPNELAKKLTKVARRLGLKKSDIARLAIHQYLMEAASPKEKNKPYEKVKNLIGSVSSGLPDLGQNHRTYLLNRLK
jgi:tRNA(Phe) wybutosine-synthesizing methylase Tyw3